MNYSVRHKKQIIAWISGGRFVSFWIQSKILKNGDRTQYYFLNVCGQIQSVQGVIFSMGFNGNYFSERSQRKNQKRVPV